MDTDIDSSIKTQHESEGDCQVQDNVEMEDSLPKDAKNAIDTGATAIVCEHYTRLCRLKAICCDKFYPCRFCHDENNTHEMNRYIVRQIQCIKCGTEQTVQKDCNKCGVRFGEYFCPQCRLYDRDRSQFHCDKCGLCRVGPREKFYHCDTCSACLLKELEGNHKCVVDAAKSSCPICLEYLHTSRTGLQIPRCGHMMHMKCLEEYLKSGNFTCPLCKESLLDMSKCWDRMDEACASVEMPEELRSMKLEILCQDCHKECEQMFNTEGLKCIHCGSYNTVRV